MNDGFPWHIPYLLRYKLPKFIVLEFAKYELYRQDNWQTY
ncbi:protein of unknown function [Lactiplantibacillus plantarum]